VTSQAERRVWRTGAAAAVVAVLVALLAGPWNFLFGSVTGSPAATRSASCLPGREVSIMDSPHVSARQLATATYNSVPPTSGPHFGFTVTTGIYTRPLSEGLTVHAMEHGHVIVQYATGTPRETVRQLERLAKRYARDVILAPYPKLDSGIALTAWGRIELLPSYDQRRATAFVERLSNRYRHGWARSDDCPGAPMYRGG
jgi:hypothetical protein